MNARMISDLAGVLPAAELGGAAGRGKPASASGKGETEHPPVPPGFGSWEEMVNGLMHNPLMRGCGDDLPPADWAAEARPRGSQEAHEVPWRGAVTGLIGL